MASHAAAIPNFALYGHQALPGWLDMVHVERIPVRSSLFDFEIEPHVHDALLQLLYVTAGGGEVFIDEVRWGLQPPCLVLVPAQAVHGFHFDHGVDGHVITTAQRPLEAVGLSLMVALLVQVARVAAAPAAEGGEGKALRSRKARQVERFRALVDEGFRSHRSLDSYAGALGVTAGQLGRLCREVLGMSALEVIHARVLHEAQRELAYSQLGIKQVAALLGFEDEAYFGRFFRKQAGMRPTEFRAMARRRLAGEGA